MAQRATSLGPKPPYFCFSLFLSLLFIRKSRFFPTQTRAFLFVFECLHFFLLAFWPPPFSPLFHFLFLCLFLSLSLSLVLFFLPSFSSFLFAFFWFLEFVSFFIFVLLCFCFMTRTTSKYYITKCFHQSFIFSLFPVLFSHWNPFFLSLLFLLLSCVSCSTWMF